MNNTFNISRFGLLLKRQWLEFGKIYLVSLAVLLGIFLTFYGFTYYDVIKSDGDLRPGNYGFLNFRVPLFATAGLIFGTLTASSYFAHLGQKPKAVIDLMIPASVFEKFLSGLFFTAIVATVSFLGLFYLTDLFFVMKIRSVVEEITKTPIVPNDRLEYFFTENSPNEFKPTYLVPFFINSVFLLGSIYFNRFHYIKTAISVMIFSGLWTAIIYKAGKLLFENRIPVVMHTSGNNGKEMAEMWMVLLMGVLVCIFWGLTYLRLKEKEV